MSEPKKVRGHHLFCMALFSGHGYSEEFSRNMQNLIDQLKKGASISVCRGEADQMCSACPNRTKDDECLLGTSDVRDRDSAALKVLNISVGDELSWTKTISLLKAVTQEEFLQVCDSCRWKDEGLCTWELLRQRSETLGLV